MCVFIHMHVPMSITVFVSLVASSFSWPPDSAVVLTLASTYAVGKGQIVVREEMRKGINQGERGHQRRRMRTRV